MNSFVYVPDSIECASRELDATLNLSLEGLSKGRFVRAWCALCYLNPGLHPDGFDESGSGWPRKFRRYAAEAWRREEIGELADEELYPNDATWAGIYDQMLTHTDQETSRRFELEAGYG